MSHFTTVLIFVAKINIRINYVHTFTYFKFEK